MLTSIEIPRSPAPARHHRAFSDDMIESLNEGDDYNDNDDDGGGGGEIQLRRRQSDRGIGSSSTYPFRQQGSAHISSQDTVPFPPSLTKSKTKHTALRSVTTSSESTSTSTMSASESTENDSSGDASDRSEEEESEERSTGRGSNSMSSLGHPISPSRRYPFGLRYPAGRGNSTSSRSHQSRPSQSGVSQSTGNQPSTEPPSSPSSSSSDHPSASPTDEDSPRASLSQSSGGSNSSIPMPPRHPNPQIRTRAPSVVPVPVVPATSIKSPGVHLRVDSGSLPGVGAELVQDDAASVSSSSSSSSDFAAHDDERQDEVGLLSPGTINVNLAVPPGLVVTSEGGGGGGGGGGGESGAASLSSRSRTGSSSPRSRAPCSSLRSRSSVPVVRSRVSSLGVAVRSQAQTLLKRVSSATSLVVPRSRVNSSMMRLEEEVVFSQSVVVPEVLSSGRSESGKGMRDDSAVAVASLTRTVMRRESSHSGVFPFLISDSRAWEEQQEGVEANRDHEMTVSSHSRSGSGSGGENWTFGRPMMFMRPSSLPVVASASASHLGREDNSGPDVMDVGIPSGISLGDDATRTGVGMEDLVGATPARATSEAVKHDDGGDDGDGNAGRGIGIDIPWDRSRLHEQYGMPDASGSGASGVSYGLMVRPDISTAAPSFVTMPLTMETTESGVGSRGSSGEGGEGGGGIGLGGIGPERRDRMGDWRQR